MKYGLVFVALDNNLVKTNLNLYCTVYANTGCRPLLHQKLAFEVQNRTMMNKYYEHCKIYNLRDVVQVGSQSSKTCFARTSVVKDLYKTNTSSKSGEPSAVMIRNPTF